MQSTACVWLLTYGRSRAAFDPLFPGYLFCRFDVTDRLMPILTTPGVIGIVGAGKTPVPIDDEEIEAIRAILRSGLAARPWPFLQVGSKVYIERGPLTGMEGIIANADKVYRLIVSPTCCNVPSPSKSTASGPAPSPTAWAPAPCPSQNVPAPWRKPAKNNQFSHG
jgi:transcription antitermination factor NusG